MLSNQLYSDYFAWMYDMVCSEVSKSYIRLFDYLNKVQFTAIIPMDYNRAEDGKNLRYAFGYSTGIPSFHISENFEGLPCSVLEMMIALAKRCEDSIMSDTHYGNRTGVWFWTMMDSLGISDMSDENFSAIKVGHVMYRFLNRTYDPDGTGGLFTIHDKTKDMRNIEIWYQMNFYLEELTGA